MSILNNPQKFKNKPFYRIIEHLGYTKEEAQYNLKDILKLSHRTIERCTKHLCYNRLIFLHRTERSSRGSYDKNIWRLTFKGILSLICWLAFPSPHIVIIDKIAKTHENEWILFNEWNYIKKDLEAKASISVIIFKNFKDYYFANPITFSRSYTQNSNNYEYTLKNKYDVDYDEYKEIFADLIKSNTNNNKQLEFEKELILEDYYYKRYATRSALLIENLIRYGKGMDYRFRQFFFYFCGNKNLREYILSEITNERGIIDTLNDIQTKIENTSILE